MNLYSCRYSRPVHWDIRTRPTQIWSQHLRNHCPPSTSNLWNLTNSLAIWTCNTPRLQMLLRLRHCRTSSSSNRCPPTRISQFMILIIRANPLDTIRSNSSSQPVCLQTQIRMAMNKSKRSSRLQLNSLTSNQITTTGTNNNSNSSRNRTNQSNLKQRYVYSIY